MSNVSFVSHASSACGEVNGDRNKVRGGGRGGEGSGYTSEWMGCFSELFTVPVQMHYYLAVHSLTHTHSHVCCSSTLLVALKPKGVIPGHMPLRVCVLVGHSGSVYLKEACGIGPHSGHRHMHTH